MSIWIKSKTHIQSPLLPASEGELTSIVHGVITRSRQLSKLPTENRSKQGSFSRFTELQNNSQLLAFGTINIL